MGVMHRRAAVASAVVFGCGGDPTASSGTTSGSSSTETTAASIGTASMSADVSSGSTAGSGAHETSGGPHATDATDATGTTGEPMAGLRYDAVRQKSAHNSYQRDEAPFDQLAYHRVRSLELDIHVGKTLAPTEDGSWYVYHSDIVDDATWCVHLDDCLDALAAFTDVADAHEIVTLWIDLKDPWDAGHGPDELDAALQAAFGDALVDGSDLLALAGCPDAASVQEGLLDPACGWPTLEALRGRVLVMLTGGSGVLRTYHDADPATRRALVAPAAASLDDAGDWPNTAVFNFDVADVAIAGAYVDAGFVVRTWDCNDEARWDAAVAAGAHHVATDKVNAEADPWARTHDDLGWPFTCRDTCEPPPTVDETSVIGVAVASGDVWDTADSAWFLHDDRSAAPGGLWQAFVSTANSHVEPFAKGCLMARADATPSSPYFAVCRPADDEPLRVQWRLGAGATSSAIENAVAQDGTLDGEGVVFVRLRVDDGGMCATGEGSTDGATWVEIGNQCFDAPLVLQGLSASGHGSPDPVRVLFGEVALDPGGLGDAFEVRDLGGFAASVAIGTAAAEVFDGVLPGP